MTVAEIRIESIPITDTYARYHGKAIDQELPDDWWKSAPEKTIKISSQGFSHTQNVDLALGLHTVEYATSGYVPDYAWLAKIYLDGKLVTEGEVGRHTHLKAQVFAGPFKVRRILPSRPKLSMLRNLTSLFILGLVERRGVGE